MQVGYLKCCLYDCILFISILNADENDLRGFTDLVDLSPGFPESCINFDVDDDNLFEGDHIATFTITSLNPEITGVTIGPNNTHLLTIMDDEGNLYLVWSSNITISY